MTTRKLTDTQEATLTMLKVMGKTERQALEYMGREVLEKTEASAGVSKPISPPANKPTERRELRDKSGKQTTLLLTEVQAAQFDALRAFGRTPEQAMDYVAQKSGGKFTPHGRDERREARREAFAAAFTEIRVPVRLMKRQATARILTEHNARRDHARECCPACASQGLCR